MPKDREPEWITTPPPPEGSDRWWTVALLLAGPVIALVVWLLGG